MRKLVEQEIAQMRHMLICQQGFNPDKTLLSTAIYARKSTEDIRQTSLPTQIQACREFIADNRDLLALDEKNIYKDDDRSGMFMDNREGFQQLLAEVRKGNIKVVVLYHHDRLSRRIADFEQIKATLEQYRVFLIFGDAYYENTPMGEFFAGLSFQLSQLEARTAANKTADTLRNKAAQGQSAGGRAPYGLKYVGKQFDIEPSEAPAVKRMFDIVARGGSYADIVRDFAANGVKTRAGGTFGFSTINDMLRNPKYAGEYVYCRKDKNGNPVNRHKYRVMLGEQEEMRNDTTVLHAIVSKKQFSKVQEILDQRERTGRPKQNAFGEYLLTGLVRCTCGEKMFGESTNSKRGKRRYRYYSCNRHKRKDGCAVKKITADTLETLVKSVVRREVETFIRSESFSAAGLNASRKRLQEHIGLLSRKVSDAEAATNKLAERAIHASETVAKRYETAIENNERQISALQAKIADLTAQKAALESMTNSPQTQTFTDEELFGDADGARKLIRLFVREIVVDNGEIAINLY